MTVLVVEDDRTLSELIELILRRSGISAEIMTRGDVAVTAIQSGAERYDAIVLDLLLPIRDGFEVLGQIEKSSAHLLSRIIVLTAVSTAVLEKFRYEQLVWRVLRKPFDLPDFVSAVVECIECHAGRTIPSRATLSHWFERKSRALGARAGVVAVARGPRLDSHAAFGFPGAMTETIFPIPVDRPYPIAVAYRNAKPVCLASLTLARAEYPLLLPIWMLGNSQAIAAFPIRSREHTIGSIGWSFDQPQAFNDEHRQALSRVSSDCYAILSRTPRTEGGRIDEVVL